MSKFKNIILLLLIIFNMLGCIVIYAAENEESSWERGYFTIDDVATVMTNDDLKVYTTDDYNNEQGTKLSKGDTIKIVQFITKENTKTNSNYDVLEVIINNKDSGYVYPIPYMENTERKSDSIFLSAYKRYFTSVKYYGGILSNRAGVFILIACVLLVLSDGKIDAAISKFVTIKDTVSMFSMILPSIITIIINIICNTVNNYKHYQILSEGFVLLPKNDTFMEWILYLSIYATIILWMYNLYRLFMFYNPIVALIKIAESLLISGILGFAIVIIGIWIIGIFIVISIFSTVSSIRYVEVREY
ncbi:hypothetical protein [Clostridium saccharobutylicum]|uniref:Uncharacterized protein n=1 Tax=Clostridium saccharobutylicum TaxID=169679 RepID=A0A1S8NHH1_CLOSA|nr:hypothetical protein [Clostridium saccharobutylicum]OOM15925.1 hypothetical protein CLOSAC_01960 [Clostridium saccharobutylicum]